MDTTEIILRLTCATLIGALIGVNRDLNDKPTGLRTMSIVGLGSAVFVMIAIGGPNDWDPASRVLQGILTGIGFLGAGVIVHDESSEKVHGLTTAASIWLTAGLGSACGMGAWRIAIVASVLIAAVLAFGGPVEKTVRRVLVGEKNPSKPEDHPGQ